MNFKRGGGNDRNAQYISLLVSPQEVGVGWIAWVQLSCGLGLFTFYLYSFFYKPLRLPLLRIVFMLYCRNFLSVFFLFFYYCLI